MLYRILHSSLRLVSRLPLGALYFLSDCFYPLVYYVVGYRRRVVRRNITSAFPEKSREECRNIERGFYHWLCDYAVETVKLLSMSREEMLRHIEFRGVEEMERCYDRGQTCAAMLGHYCNWEYLSATQLSYRRHTGAVCGLIYHPLRNKLFDRLFIDIRQSMGGVCVPKREILRYLIKYKREGRMNLFGYIADQAPKYKNTHLWLPFMHHDTGVFTGAERIIRKMNNAVFYVDMQRPRRGKYICTFHLMTRDPAQLPENELTRRFFAMLEDTIRRNPSLYLWSHDRWRRTREEFDRGYYIENGHVIKR